MMRVLPILFVAACTVEAHTPAPDAETPPAQTFPQDTYFTGLAPMYASPEACLAANPGSPGQYQCTWELGFCASGKVSLREGDVVGVGDYHLEGADAVAAIGDREVELDTMTVQATGTLATWIPDTVGRWMTEDFDLSSCP